MMSSPETVEAVHCRGERFRLYLDAETIQQRIRDLGQQISREYEGKTPILVGILNGSFMFIADLMRAMQIDCEVDFLKLSSYGAAKVSSGQVRELKKIDAHLEGRHVIVVEDIVDTGLTAAFIMEKVRELHPASVRMVTLLHKPEATKQEVELDYVGFEIPNLFVIGYGLDYGQLGRNFPAIYILDNAAETSS